MFGPNAGTIQLLCARRRSAHSVRVGGIRRKLLIGLVLLIAIIGVLPIVVAKTHLRNLLVAMGLPNDAIRVTIGSASLSWTSNPLFQNVEVKDASGETLLVAESISIDRTPLKLAMNTHDLGTIQIVHPTLHVQVRPDGNTINDVLQKLQGSTAGNVEQPASPDVTQAGSTVEVEQKSRVVHRQPAFAVELVGATVIADDVAANRQWRLQNVNVQYDGRSGGDRMGPASANGEIYAIDRGAAPLPAGRFTATVKSNEAGLAEINLQADRIALAVAEPWLRQLQNGTELSGSLSGQATATCTLTSGKLPVDLVSSGSLSIDQLNATTPSLNGDRVRLARIELPWRISAQPTGLTIQDLQLRSDVAELSVRGQIDPNAITHPNTTFVQFLSSRNDVEIRGAADLAKLAAMLPRSIHLRSDTTITSGTANISASLKPTSDGSQVHASVSTAQLAGTRGGKSIQWDQPINADIGVRQAKGTIADGSLKCDSKFLRVEAAGTLQQLTGRANFDLNALTEQLGQFIDLSGIQLAGTGTAQLAWQQPAAGAFSATASGELSQLRVAFENKSICDEPQLTLQAQANGTADVRTYVPTRIDAARLQLNGQGDQLDARIASSVDFTGAECVWPVAVHSTGSISRWLSRVRPWVSVDPWKIDGGTDFTANVRVAADKFEATDTKLVVTDLRAINPDWSISEPRIEFAGDARWNGTTGEFDANSAQLVSSTIALAAKGIHFGGSQPASQLAGAAAFRTDLGRLGSWRTQPNRAAQYQSTGQLTGNLRFTQVSGRVVGELAASGQNLSLAADNKTIWQEPQLTIRGSTTYDTTVDRLSFDQFQIQSNTLQAAAAGQVQKLSTVADCELNGTLNYDLAQVTPLLRPYLGSGVQLTGREQARFALAGKLSDGAMPRAQLTAMTRDPYTTSTLNSGPSSAHWSRRIRAQLDLPWTGANVYGLPIGGGRIGATLGDGALRIAPISLSVGDGQLAAAPSVQFDPEPAVLSLPAGPVLTNVRISPEVSESMLKFVAPVLAGATQSDGLFSLQLDGARVPLAEPRLAESAGQFTVHSVRVVPGPNATPWVGLGQQIEGLVKRRDPAALSGRQVTLVTIRDQQVNFRVKDGRVYHQNIEFQIGDVTMRSQGSVGFDETIALTLEIPVQDAWIAKDPLLSGLKGQVLQVPVTGTLTKPKMDQHALTHLTSQLIQKGAGQAVGNELNKALDKFLKPRQ